MSRIGKLPIPVPDGVKVSIDGNTITVTGPKGTLKETFGLSITVKLVEKNIIVERKSDDKQTRALHGLIRSLINNMVRGVTEGFRRGLIITGMGYRVAKQGNNIVINIGFSHPVTVKPTPGIDLEVEGTNKIVVKGTDKQKVGQVAANLRAIRPPDPYKGKGILPEELIGKLKFKPGKAGKGAAK